MKRAWAMLRRDLDDGHAPSHVAAKALRYSVELATAQMWLRDVTELGSGVRTLKKPTIENYGTMIIGHNTLLRSINVPVELACGPGATLTIGPDCFINYGASFGCTKAITVGARCRIGPYAMVVDTNFHDLHDRSLRPEPEAVVLEDDVWLGAKVSVLPGVTIGRGSVVGTGSVVTKNVPPFSVVAGVPAKLVKKLDPEKFVVRPTIHPE